ncbi:hypothetical protein [Pseudomonas sp. GD03944]|uniref:hypothetical protein n=1 Tax=Pseudomonas sp. GD03944 TaxID=2975409 RepID=UPI002449E3E3|nr:hypothetical protein [Pseudomonas sp. GD03944]MDH1265780.1 hypothetical protein [Pseudomonas sp. GD03944]
MSSRKPVTADTLLSQTGPQVTKVSAEALAADEQALVAAANALGYAIESVWDFVNNTPRPGLDSPFTGPYERAYPMLIEHLRQPHHPRIREGIIRALTVKDGGEAVWSALYQAFTEETDNLQRWTLANALSIAMPPRQRAQHPEIARVFKNAGAL